MEKVNVYDFDKTILPYDSTAAFCSFCFRRNKRAALAGTPALLAFPLYALRIISKTRAKEILYGFLKAVPDIDAEVKYFWESRFKDINAWYLEKKRDDDIIISASPDFLLRPVAEALGVCLIASKVDKLSGKTEGENNYGQEKVRRLRKEFPEVLIAEFYSDSLSDSPLAELSELAYLVKGTELHPWPPTDRK